MSAIPARPPVAVGEMAPDFSLPAVHRQGTVSLADYKGRQPLLLAMFRGLYCPFCRRAIAQFSAMSDKLKQLGVAGLAVVATEPDNARLYFKHRPAKLELAADENCTIHQAFGLPSMVPDEQLMQAMDTITINPTGELPQPMKIAEAGATIDRIDGFTSNATDQRDAERNWTQIKGQFLLDREGIVRWSNIECARDGLAGLGRFPSEDEMLQAVRQLA